MLKLQHVSAHYGKVEALRSISIEVEQGQIVTMIGANGAGKSSTLKVISGLLRPTAGTAEFGGLDLSKAGPEAIVEHGLIHVPEGRRLFPGLTVYDNLLLGASSRRRLSKRWRQEAAQDLAQVYAIFPALERLAGRLSWMLSGGEQQMCAIGRGLMARPRLLLLDEPSLGLAPVLVQEVFRTITAINRLGVTILLVEQNARQALAVAHQAYVLETGATVLSGPAASLLNDEQVRAAYLGSHVAPPAQALAARPGQVDA